MAFGMKQDAILGIARTTHHPGDTIVKKPPGEASESGVARNAKAALCKMCIRDRLSKLVHRPACKFVVQSQLKKFSLKERLIVTGVRNLTRLGKEACWGQDLDPMVGVDDPRSKSDGRNMSLPRGAQAEDKTQSAGRQVRLVGVRDDGRIEQCCRF